MLPGFQDIVERRIREAQEKGAFNNLPGRGEPLQLEVDSHVPEDLRLAYKILKNADCVPPEVELRKEIFQMKDMLASLPDEKEKVEAIRRLNFKISKLNAMGRRSCLLEEKEIYYSKIVDKLTSK